MPDETGHGLLWSIDAAVMAHRCTTALSLHISSCMHILGRLLNDKQVQNVTSCTAFLQEPNVLRLLDFSQGKQLQEGALQLAFHSPLLPHVALDVAGPQPCIYALTARGFLHCISLSRGPAPSSSRAGPGQQASVSQLSSIQQDSIVSVDLTAGALSPYAVVLYSCLLQSSIHV